MNLSRIMKNGVIAVAATVLCACATVPQDIEQTPSETWQKPEETQLGIFFDRQGDPDNEQSGVFLLDEPRTALRARLVLAALAEKTLDIQYYLWKGDLTGELLLHRALQAADRGVKVRILIDDIFHSGRDAVYAAIDAHPMLELRVFNPIGNRRVGRNLNYIANKKKLNHRMHNKIFLVDGAAAILGGRNIGDDYFGIDPDLNFRDLDVLTVGPAAAEAGNAYDLYWNSKSSVPVNALRDVAASSVDLEQLRTQLNDSLGANHALPYTVPVSFEDVQNNLEELRTQLVWADVSVIVDPIERFDGGSESAFVKWSAKLTADVKEELVLQSAYLIPTEQGIETIAGLTARGVRIRALTNSLMSNNHVSVHSHYMKYRKPMIAAGLELHEFRADSALRKFLKIDKNVSSSAHSGLHTKAVVADRRLSMIGSFNMDPRSRDLNSEIGLIIDSVEFAENVLEVMDIDFDPANSYRVTLDEKQRTRWTGTEGSNTVTFKNEPGASIWKRMTAALIRLIPIEKEL